MKQNVGRGSLLQFKVDVQAMPLIRPDAGLVIVESIALLVVLTDNLFQKLEGDGAFVLVQFLDKLRDGSPPVFVECQANFLRLVS